MDDLDCKMKMLSRDYEVTKENEAIAARNNDQTRNLDLDKAKTIAQGLIPEDVSSIGSDPDDPNDPRNWYSTIGFSPPEHTPTLQDVVPFLIPQESSSNWHHNYAFTNDDDDYLEYIQYLALQDTLPEEEFINPFAEGGEGTSTSPINNSPNEILAAGREGEGEEWLSDYPPLRALSEQVYSQQAVSQYRPPQDTVMGPVGYPPRIAKQEPVSLAPSYQPARGQFKRREPSEWNLPSAQQPTGAILTIPIQLHMFDDVFMRWKSISKNVVASQNFTDPLEKIEFIENLLGGVEKLTWIQWRMAYPNEFQEPGTRVLMRGCHIAMTAIHKPIQLAHWGCMHIDVGLLQRTTGRSSISMEECISYDYEGPYLFCAVASMYTREREATRRFALKEAQSPRMRAIKETPLRKLNLLERELSKRFTLKEAQPP
ncbi:hypothetical protein ZIOFF_061138 [Zingiber officinale]|uniref:Uncharacterized protein n=1 Tax=Zingiber officinale TaxID=94328 RepID=A0A8J5EYY8_ZINOF|nr:hypothetical protein ZIOFF_061138 [Zingiber officinale]